MLKFWLFTAIITFLVITFLCFKEGFKLWSAYYVLSFIALIMYFLKKIMVKRMMKHLQYLEEQKNKN